MDLSRIYNLFERILVTLATPALPADAATATKQSDGSQVARAMGLDGATQRQVKVDGTGQVAVAATQLPVALDGGALKVKEQSPLDLSPLATLAKQDDQIDAINAPTRGTVSRGSLSWAGAAWDGTAAKKITLGAANSWIRVESLQNPPVTAGGGMTRRYIAICEVGAPIAAAMVQSDDTAGGELAAAQINFQVPTPGRLLLLDASGQADVYCIPDAGTTEGTLTVEVSKA